jgi:hypothetical protein
LAPSGSHALVLARCRGGNEVDLLVEWGQRLYAIDCKHNESPDRHDLRGIRRLREFYGDASLRDRHRSVGRERMDVLEAGRGRMTDRPPRPGRDEPGS